jgi:hypothetical protein
MNWVCVCMRMYKNHMNNSNNNITKKSYRTSHSGIYIKKLRNERKRSDCVDGKGPRFEIFFYSFFFLFFSFNNKKKMRKKIFFYFPHTHTQGKIGEMLNFLFIYGSLLFYVLYVIFTYICSSHLCTEVNFVFLF